MRTFIKYLHNRVKYRNKVSFAYDSDIQRHSYFEGFNHVATKTSFWGYMGRYSYIASNSRFEGKIGRFTSIGPNVCVLFGLHPYTYPFVSTSPVFISPTMLLGKTFSKDKLFKEENFADSANKYPVVIGNDCWINGNVVLNAGIHIGDGAVVLSGAVVTKDVEPYTIVAGVPAKPIRKRYSDEDIQMLLKIRWWDMPDEWIAEHQEILTNMDLLKKYYIDHNFK